MKYQKSLVLICYLALFVLLSVVVSAQSLDIVEDTIIVSLGQGATTTVGIDVENTGTTNIEVQCDTTLVDLVDNDNDKIALTCSDPGVISPNQTKTVVVTLTSDLLIDFETFGGFLFIEDTNSSAEDSVELLINIQLDVCDFGSVGNALTIRVDDPEQGDDFEPGDRVRIDTNVKNVGLNDKRVQLEAFLFTEGGRRIADTSSETKNIEDGKDEDFELFLRIPLKSAEIDPDDNFDLIVKAFDDENERLDCVQEMVSVDIKLKNRKVVIRPENTEFLNQFAVCGDSVFATVEVMNIGKKDNENVRIFIENPELGILEESGPFSIEAFTSKEDNVESKQFRIPIPEDAKEKTYVFDIDVKFEGGSTTTTRSLAVTCGQGFVVRDVRAPIIMNLPKRVIETNAGTSITLPVELTNNQNKKAIFFVSLKNVGDFAQPSLRSVTLNPGQKNTVFLDVIVRDDAEPLVYTGVIEVRSTTKVVASDTITIEVLDAETEEEPVSLFENVPVVFWIILNIVILALIVLAVRFVLQKK